MKKGNKIPDAKSARLAKVRYPSINRKRIKIVIDESSKKGSLRKLDIKRL